MIGDCYGFIELGFEGGRIGIGLSIFEGLGYKIGVMFRFVISLVEWIEVVISISISISMIRVWCVLGLDEF